MYGLLVVERVAGIAALNVRVDGLGGFGKDVRNLSGDALGLAGWLFLHINHLAHSMPLPAQKHARRRIEYTQTSGGGGE